MNHFALQLFTGSWQAGVIATLLLLARMILRHRLNPTWRCALWSIVLVRLLLPTIPSSNFSLFGIDRFRRHTATPSTPIQSTPMSEGFIIRTGLLPAEPTGIIIPSATPVNTPIAKTALTIFDCLAGIWLLGVIFLGARLIGSNARFARKLSAVTPTGDGPLYALLQSSCNELHIQHAPTMLLTDEVSVPALHGVFHPRLLLPHFAPSLPPAQLRLILLHELSHLKSRDLAVDWLCTALNVVHWFNPLLWLATSHYRADRELLRDAEVLRAAGAESAECYGLTILNMASLPRSTRHRPMLAAFIQGPRRIHERNQMIASFKSRRSRFSIVGVLLMIGIGCSTLTGPKPEKKGEIDDSAGMPMTLPRSVRARPIAPAEDLEERRVDTRVLEKQAAAVRKVDAALARIIPEANYNGKSLLDVIDGIKDETPVNIFVNWNELEKVGVSRKAPVNARMENISLRKMIRVVLEGAAGDKTRLGFFTDEFGVEITTLEEERQHDASTRTYDIRDLLVEVPDYEPDFSPSPTAGLITKPATTREKSMTRQDRVNMMIRLIKETVDPDSWRDNGAHLGAIQELSGQLIVTQSADAHMSLQNLLLQLRETRGLQIQVDTKFVLLDAWAVEHFNLHPLPATRPSSSLNDAQIATLLHPKDGTAHARVIAGLRLQVYNGQRGYVLMATQRRYISGYSVDAARNHFDPTLDTAEQGAMIDVQATISSDRKYATLTLRPRITRLDRFDDEIWPDSPADHPLKIQRPINSVRLLQTTVSVPDQQTVVVGGFVDSVIGDPKSRLPATAPSKPTTRAATDEPSFLSQLMTPPISGMELFLFVRPTIILDGPPPHEPAVETGR